MDLSVSHGEHPDEIVLGPSLNSTHLDRPSLPKNARSPAAQLTPRKDLQLPRPPLAQISSLVIVPGPGPQAPFIAGMTNRAQGHPPPQKPLQQQQGQSTPKQPLNRRPPIYHSTLEQSRALSLTPWFSLEIDNLGTHSRMAHHLRTPRILRSTRPPYASLPPAPQNRSKTSQAYPSKPQHSIHI